MKDDHNTQQCRLYFTTFLPGILNQLLLEDLKSLSCCFAIEVTDSGDPPWRLAIDEGRLTYVGPEGPEPACQFCLDAAALLDVASARVSPQEAFFDLRIQLEGDMELGLTLSTVLAPFFQQHPFVP